LRVRSTPDINIIRHLQLDSRASNKRIPVNVAVRFPLLAIYFNALDENGSSSAVAWVPYKVFDLDGSCLIIKWIVERDIGEVRRREQQLARRG